LIADVIEKAISISFFLMVCSGVIYSLYFGAFPYTDNIRRKGGRISMRLNGSFLWNARTLISEYIEPKRQSQAFTIFQVTKYSFIAFVFLFICSIFINVID